MNKLIGAAQRPYPNNIPLPGDPLDMGKQSKVMSSAERALLELGGVVNQLQEVVNTLEERLTPMMVPSVPGPTAADASACQQAPYLQGIEHETLRLNEVAGRIHGILARVAL